MSLATPSPTFLAPPPFQRPTPKRLLSLQTTSPPRPAPYSVPHSASSSTSASTSTSMTPRRPGAPHRSHSFCGDSSASTFALASAGAGKHLSPNKAFLVAPPLERTVSSMGQRENLSKPMMRPSLRPMSPVDANCSARPPYSLESYLDEETRTTPPKSSPPVPKIMIHPTFAGASRPVRPTLAHRQSSSDSLPPSLVLSRSSSFVSSRSSSFCLTPCTPSPTSRYAPIMEGNDKEDPDGDMDVAGVEEVIDNVSDLVL